MEQTNNNIVEYLAANRTIEGICRALHINQAYTLDLTQEIYIILLQLDKTKLKDLYDNDQLNFWLVKVVKNQYYGGPFFRTWRKNPTEDLESIMYKI